MAKLPNIIEKERSLWQALWFVFRDSFKASKKHSSIRYITSIINAILSIAQFGAFGIIVNEFVTYGATNARYAVLIKGLVLLIITQFGPSILGSLNNYA